jgi:hypothetical protein
MAQLNFKASNIVIEERTGGTYGPLPAGDYEMMIVKSDTKATKANNGHYLECEMHVISGEHSGRRHWERFNLDNPNPQAVKIAQESLARLCAAIGVDEVDDSEQLHDRPFIAEIGIDKKDDTRNVIWNYKSALETTKPVVNNHKPAPSAAPAKSARPWG